MATVLAPKELFTPGTQYRLPEAVCSTLPKIHPDYPTIYERNAIWMSKFMPFPDATTMLRTLEKQYLLWDVLVYPLGLTEDVYRVSCLHSLMYEVDDTNLLERALFEQIVTSMDGNHSYGQAFSNALKSLREDMSETFYQRYLQSWRQWFAYTLKENEWRSRNEIPDIDTYLPIRRISVAGRPPLIGLEYVLGLDLTELMQSDPQLQEAVLAVGEHAMLVNDLFSFRKECFKGDYCNLITCLMHVHGHSLQESIEITCEKIRDVDENLSQLCAILRHRYSTHPQMEKLSPYINSLPLFCAGNLRWSLETSRYHGYGYVWNGLRSGIVTLYPDRTIIELE
jgi:hypothetical protein